MRKAVKKAVTAEAQKENSHNQAFQTENSVTENVKKRKTLEVLSQAIFSKNYNLYLDHEKMLDEEKSKRADLAKNFQE